MKRNFLLTGFYLLSLALIAQTPIDEMQKRNVAYLEQQEQEGYTFRSQIITEFDEAHALQDVNIKLDAQYTYQLVAMGDSDIKAMQVSVKSNEANTQKVSNDAANDRTSALLFKPEKSGRYKIMLQVDEFSANGKGFISFMVLRK